MIVFLIITFFAFLNPQTTFAIATPTQTSPSDGSTTSSSSVNWQAVDGSNEYRVIIDDEPSVTGSNIRDYYTTSTKYSPQLSPGTYFWKVEARDQSNNWSSWSPVWSFSLTNSTPTPTSSSNPTASSTPSADFSVTGVPTNINSDQWFVTSVNLYQPNSPNTSYYLKGAFIKEGSSNYFGLTKVDSNWIKNGSSYSSQIKISTDSSGHWSGNIEVMPDNTDSGFTGTGSYTFKIAWYSDSGSGPTWSNETTINITGAPASQPTTSSSKSTSTPKASALTSINPISQNKSLVKLSSGQNSASVAGAETVATPSSSATATDATTQVKDQQTFNFLPFLGGGLVFIGVSLIVYIYLKQRYNS